MADRPARRHQAATFPRANVTERVIKEGWCTKESGQAFLGRTNWQKRWFRLVQKGSKVILSYYKKIDDKQPAGVVWLDSTYCTRELEVGEKKNKPNCFAVGPISEDGTLRTYYVFCETEDEKLEWMEVINATIEGVPELAEVRKKTVKQKFMRRSQRRSNFKPKVNKNEVFINATWRKEQWAHVCSLAGRKDWKYSDTKHGITVGRLSFGKNDYAIIKTEGIVNVPMDVMYDYLQRAIRSGGKLDYAFRNEDILETIKDELPHASVGYCRYKVPLPGMSPRDFCFMRTWFPCGISNTGTGVLLVSVDHSSKPPPAQDAQYVVLEPSAIILRPEYSQEGLLVTYMMVVVQVNVQGSLQTMLEGSFKSGLLKVGLRTAFSYVRDGAEKYLQSLQ